MHCLRYPQYPVWIHCCKRPNYDFCISQGSLATVFKWGGKTIVVSFWCCMPKIIKIGQCFTEHHCRLDLTKYFFSERIIDRWNCSDQEAVDVQSKHKYRVAQKMAPFFLYPLTLPNINRFSQLFHCKNQEKICNNDIAKDPTTPQLCRYTTLWNVSS